MWNISVSTRRAALLLVLAAALFTGEPAAAQDATTTSSPTEINSDEATLAAVQAASAPPPSPTSLTAFKTSSSLSSTSSFSPTTASTTSSLVPSGYAVAADDRSLYNALANPSVTNIILTKNIYLNPANWATRINVGRNVHIYPSPYLIRDAWNNGATPPILNLTDTYRAVNLAAGVRVTLSLLEVVHKDRGWPFSFFLGYPYTPDNAPMVVLRFSVNHIMMGPPLNIGSNYQYTPRPAQFPGTQKFTFWGDNWCLPNGNRCYRQAAYMEDIAFQLPDMGNNFGTIILAFQYVPVVLDSFLPETCPEGSTPEQCVTAQMIIDRMTGHTGSTGK